MPENELTDEQAAEIRRLYVHEGWSQGRLARHFKRAVGTIGRIVRGETHQKAAMPQRLDMNEEIKERARVSQEAFLAKERVSPSTTLPDELKPKVKNPYT